MSVVVHLEPVSNVDIVTSVLRGLGPDYAMLVTAI